MPKFRLSFFVASAVAGALFVSVILLAGCGGGETTAAAPLPSVDPRQASADAVVSEFNRLVGSGRGIDAGPLFDLFYAENDLQRRILTAFRGMVPLFDLDRAMWSKFNEGMEPDGENTFGGFLNRAEIGERTAQRATAMFVEKDGTEASLLLVKIGEEWWISGFTFEHDPSFDGEAGLAEMQQIVDILCPIAATIAGRINNGEFTSAAEARLAVAMAAAARFRETGVPPNPIDR